MSENPYRTYGFHETRQPPPPRAGIRPVTALLIGATLIPAGLLLLALGNILYFSMTEPPPVPGDPNIGLGILKLAIMLNLPIALAWLLWWFAKPTKD